MLAVLSALEEEIVGFRRLMVVAGIDFLGDCRIYRGSYCGHEFLLVNHGVGKRRTLSAVRTLLDRYPVTAIVSIGYAGGLLPGCHTGDLYLCSRISCAEDPVAVSHYSDSRLLSLADGCKMPGVCRGTGVTASRLVSSPDDKQILREASKADIVDMESYWIARLAAENGIPFIIARAVSDAAGDTFPELPSYRWHQAIRYFIWHPLQGWRLYRGMRRARHSLTRFAAYIVAVAG